VFQYTQKERQTLEVDINALNDKTSVEATDLFSSQMNKVSVVIADIESILVGSTLEKNNTYNSTELRTPHVIEVPFTSLGNGDDIGWIYGAFKRYKECGIALTPDEEAQYLAYKCILERDELSEGERSKIFNKEGKVSNADVAYHILFWRKKKGTISAEQVEILKKLVAKSFSNRMSLLEEEFRKIGLSCEKLSKQNPEAMALLLDKTCHFHEMRFNVVGKHLLYLDFKGLLHIYLRHVKELQVSSQFANKDKFQLLEKDVFTTMRILFDKMNDDYQKWKPNHLNDRFHWFGPRTYYNGDYYQVYVNVDGSIDTFFKTSGKGKASHS
jgi:hypothetical protein